MSDEYKISEKDNFSREYFFTSYKFDLFTDHELFDYKIDISQFISAPTLEASKISVSVCQNIILTVVEYYFEPSITNFEKLTAYLKKFGTEVFQKVPSYVLPKNSR